MRALRALFFLAAILVTTSSSILASPPAGAEALRYRRAPADNCGYFVFAIGTYDDWSELEFTVSFCSPSGKVNGGVVKPDCYNGENPPAISIGPGETASSFFGFSPWAGYTPCQAIEHAPLLTCPVTYGGSTTIDFPDPPSVQRERQQ